MKYLSLIVLALMLAVGGGAALAADDGRKPAKFNEDYMEAMKMMHGSMMEGIMDSDPDVAFVKGMIPHHTGAVVMAELQLKYGHDPAIRKLAQDIIDAQNKEIAFMEDWLQKKQAAK